jgi:hypothetical protein
VPALAARIAFLRAMMGMDAIEIVMNLEDEFRISISDDDAMNMQTLGDTLNSVIKGLAAARLAGRARSSKYFIATGTVDRAAVWEVIRKMVAKQAGVKIDTLNEDTKYFGDLF